MKKGLILVVLIMYIFTIKTEALSNIGLNINNSKVKFGIYPFVENGVLFLPVRDMFELYGFKVLWNDKSQTAVCSKNNKSVAVQLRKRIIKIDNKDYVSAADTKIVGSRFYAAKDAIEQGLQIDIELSDKDKTVYIKSKSQNNNLAIQGDNNTFISGKSLIVSISENVSIDKVDKSIGDADKLVNEGNYTGAIRSYENILKSVSSVKNPEKYGRLHCKLGKTYIYISGIVNKEENALKALASFEEVLKTAKPDKLPVLRAYGLQGMGKVYLLLGQVRDTEKNITKAISYYDEALALVPKDKYAFDYANSLRYKAQGLINLFFIRNSKETLKSALSSCEGALEIYKDKYLKEYSETKRFQGLALSLLNTITGEVKLIEESLAAYEEAIKFTSKKDNPLQYSYIKFHMGVAYEYLVSQYPTEDYYNKGIAAYLETAEVSSLEKNPLIYAKSYNHLAIMYLLKSNLYDKRVNLEKALNALLEAEKGFEIVGNPLEYALLQADFGTVYGRLAQFDQDKYFNKAIASFEKSINIFTFEKYPDHYAKSYVEMGIVYNSSNISGQTEENAKKALKCFDEALRVYKLEKDPVYYAYVKTNLAMSLMELAGVGIDYQANVNEAIEALNIALGVFNKEDFPYHNAQAQSRMGKAYFLLAAKDNKEENLRKSLQYCKNALEYYTADKETSYYAELQKRIEDINIMLSEIINKDTNSIS